jgi:PAS domain S-box-containing protein
VVDLLEHDGSLRHVASAAAPAAQVAELAGLRGAVARGEPPRHGVLPGASGSVSYLVVPLVLGPRRIGALTLLSSEARPAYADADLPVALELAERCSQALHNAQLYDDATSSRALLDTLFATAPVGLCVLDTSMRFLLMNERMAELTGRPPAEHLGRRLDEMYADQRGTATSLIHSVLSTGEAVRDVEIVAGARAFLASYAPVAAEGRTLGVICAVVETTERHRVQAERDRLHDRTARLQEVTERLSAALTADEVVEVILTAGMAATGATCGVLALRDGAELVIDHRIGMGGAAAPARLGLELEMPLPIAARTAQPVLLPSREAWLKRMAHPPRGDFEAFAAVPLRFEGGVPGVMGLGFADERDFDAAEVALLDAIARQGAQALERARLYEERAYVARTLQRGLLPRELPAIEGLDVAVRYRPVGDGHEVGGDFYDVFAAADGWLVAVGDVCGKGTEAAVLTGVVRNTIRALAVRDTEPAAIVAGVNEALLREGSPHALSSVACGSVRRAAGGFVVTLAAGGHPPSLLRRAGGHVEPLAPRGPMLGVERGAVFEQVEIGLAPGDLLLLYTDGVIDARCAGTPTFGEARLAEVLGGDVPDAAAALGAIDRALRAYAPGPPRDDKALLALRVLRV